MKRKLHYLSVIFAILLLPATAFGISPPPIPLLLYGNITIDGQPAPVGIIITAQINTINVATTSIAIIGKYFIEIPDGVANEGKMIKFKVNGIFNEANQRQCTNISTIPSINFNLAVTTTSPTASPSAGAYSLKQNVSLASTGALSIHYTTDGTSPTCATGSVYSNPIAVNAPKTIKAISCYPNGIFSSVASFVYIINQIVTPSGLPSLLDNGTLAPTGNHSATSTPSLNVTQETTINVSSNNGTSSVLLPGDTIITSTNGQNFDATALTATGVSTGSLSGLGSGAVVDGALQWGITNLGLQFSIPIVLSIYVGDSFNGQTLNVQRSLSGNSGWTSDGIVPPATCVVAAGFCSFSATKASYYATYHLTSPLGGGNTGSGGGSYTSPVTATSTLSAAAQKVDSNKDGKVDILDFNALMINWGKTGTNVADFNSDGKVDIFDFNLLMINWGK